MSDSVTDIRAYLLEKIRAHHFLQTIPAGEIERALTSCFNLFPGVIKPFFDGSLDLQIKKMHSQNVSILDEVLPGLIFAHRHFGEALPQGLTKKLQNPPQTTDTLFELKCLGVFQDKHCVVYEPKLLNKVPDFKIALDGGPDIYVECKVQRVGKEARFAKVFDRVASEICKAIEKLPFIASAWADGLRTEVFPDQTVSSKEIVQLQKALERTLPTDYLEQRRVTTHLVVKCIPRNDAPGADTSMRHGIITVPGTPVHIGHENIHLLVHSWASLDAKRRRSQRELLADARKKLKGIPKKSLGMICIQTYSARKLLPDIASLMEQKEYETVPFVWLNPFDDGQIVCRNQYLPLRDALFLGIVKQAKPLQPAT